MKVLVVFDTKHGASQEVAGRIAAGIREEGGGVEILDLRVRGASKADLGGFDAIALGGPSYMGRWSRRAAAFAASREAELAAKELAVFVVGNDKDGGSAPAKTALPEALASRSQAAYFGGRLDFPKLSGFERFIIKKVTGKAESSSTLDLEAAEEFGRGIGKRGRV